jgi:very-short-patch-repair endonuclease
MTLAEILLWKRIKGRQILGCDFDRQRPIGEYIVDFYCKMLRLAIEVDGRSHDFKEDQDVRR